MHQHQSMLMPIEIDDDDDDDGDIICVPSSSSPPIQIVSVEGADELKLCRVCGQDGAKNHYGGLSCAPCKMFFRRHYQFQALIHHCLSVQKCQLNSGTRRVCRHCRLKRCFQIGMQIDSFRHSHSTDQTIPSLDPLYQHRLLLNNHQWIYLRNIVNLYNNQSSVRHIRQLSSLQAREPMKIRLKMAPHYFLDIIGSLYQSVLYFITVLPEYRSIPWEDRCILIERNLPSIGAFNGILLFRDADLPSSPVFSNGLSGIYGSSIAEIAIRIGKHAEQDAMIIKMFLPVLLFSTSFHVSYSDQMQKNRFLISPQRLFYIQNLYLDMIFKYLIYRFGYVDASLRFSTMIKTILDQMICLAEASHIQMHQHVLKTIMEDARLNEKL